MFPILLIITESARFSNLSLHSSGLPVAHQAIETLSVKAYLTAIVEHQPTDHSSLHVFKPQTIKKFMKGLQNACPDVKPPHDLWSLLRVLSQLTKHRWP